VRGYVSGRIMDDQAAIGISGTEYNPFCFPSYTFHVIRTIKSPETTSELKGSIYWGIRSCNPVGHYIPEDRRLHNHRQTSEFFGQPSVAEILDRNYA
jgi:hypothetical protein